MTQSFFGYICRSTRGRIPKSVCEKPKPPQHSPPGEFLLLIISVHSRFVDGKYRDKCINTQPHDTFLHLDYGERHRYHRSFCFSSLVFANHASVSQVSVLSHRMPPTSCCDSSSVAQQENRYSERCPIELHFVEHHRGWQTRRTFTNPVSIKICYLLRVG